MEHQKYVRYFVLNTYIDLSVVLTYQEKKDVLGFNFV